MSWAYGFRSPSVKELFFSFVDINHFVIGRADLKPERSVNLRGEIIWKSFTVNDREIKITTTAFFNKVRDKIVLSALGPVHYEYQNVDKWQTGGVSARITTMINSWLRFQSDVISTGFNNPQREETLQTYLWSTDWANDLTVHLLKDRLTCSIWHKMTGKTPFFYNENGSTKQGFTDRWQMLNIGFASTFPNQNIRFNFGVKNILNVKQLQVNSTNGIHIEASNQQNLHWGRNFYVAMTWQWQK
jgi:outer membrane receptor for ferrienterochelin and colicins